MYTMKNVKKIMFGASITLTLATACTPTEQISRTDSGLDPNNFITEVRGKQTSLFTMKNSNGMEVCITNFGGRIVSILVPNKADSLLDVVLGFDNVINYVDSINTPTDFGSAIGRYANRINKGHLNIDGDSIQLPVNNFGHSLHGGPQGWQYQVYDGQQPNDSTIIMTMLSADGEACFPGEVKAVVTYTLTSDNSIDIKYNATTTKKTVINMTNHSYFNLSGDPSKPITDHVLYLNADTYTPVDSTYMTTGKIVPVKDTPMDFTTPRTLGRDIKKFDFEQIKNANGYDHNWCLNTKGNDTQVAASLYSPISGILLEVYTNEPGIQFYSGNFLEGKFKGKKGIVYNQHAGMCLETQKYPDSPNKPEWPSAYLEPGQTYYSHCVFKFSIQK